MSCDNLTKPRRNQEFPSTSHPICDGCEAFCCKTRFGWTKVALTDSDLLDGELMDVLKAEGVYDGDRYMRLPGKQCVFLREGRCSIYAIRPVACRNVLCFSEQQMRSVNSPVMTNYRPWLRRLAWHGLSYARYGQPHPKAFGEHRKSVVRFYDLKAFLSRKPGGFGYEPVISFNLGGVRHCVRSLERVPKELSHDILDILRRTSGRRLYNRWFDSLLENRRVRQVEESSACAACEAAATGSMLCPETELETYINGT